MPIDNVDAVMAEMEAEIKESGEDKFGRKPEEVAEAEGVVESDPVDAVIAEKKEVVGEDEEDEEELERQAASEDPRKRNGVFGKFRKENKELRQAVEDERKAKQELAERVARLEGRHEATVKTETTTAKVEEDREPDKLIYPDDHRDWEIRQMRKENTELRDGFKSLQQIQQATQEEQGVSLLESQYKTANPKESYDDAVKFLWEREKANKKLLAPNLTDAQIDVQIKAEKVQLFKNLYANGQRNAAEVLVQLAKNSGWAPTVAGAKKDIDLKKVADNQRRTSNLIGGSPASKGSASSDDILNMSLKKAMRVAHENPGAFDGEYGEN